MIIDNELKSGTCIRNMCKKAAQELGVLNRISLSKKKNLYLICINMDVS